MERGTKDRKWIVKLSHSDLCRCYASNLRPRVPILMWIINAHKDVYKSDMCFSFLFTVNGQSRAGLRAKYITPVTVTLVIGSKLIDLYSTL